ncbi:type I-C CRISPR-associated endonuclease Cas1c [Loigolactobacillus binensis]|uniref:CRISPR-associated endonuclease Cas1 n=1 Tax=Loigolactobacillus binensis TaxID=2559922 RepID=A0ABW3E8J2_9LACO|nr:type I-C CRISPR-associated endonuclease Cas1c [Loigolactobacillus binensis]
MKKLLNTLFVTTPNAYLFLDGGNIGIRADEQVLGKVPLLNLEGVVTFGRSGASPALMSECMQHSIPMTFLSPQGKFLGRVIGISKGNVVLRKRQYHIAENLTASSLIARNFIIGKIYNQRWMLERATRDHGLVIDTPRFKSVSSQFKEVTKQIIQCVDLETIRGIEGNAATQYYSLFDQLILQQKDNFQFHGRNRRPPLDNVNALLSFTYTLLAHDTAAALETVGLDAYVGFMHQDRPGRISLALDLMEELRGVYADRFVLRLINKRIVSAKDFQKKENGAVLLRDEARKRFLTEWQARKQDTIVHPYLNEKIAWGLVPYCQALLLARYLRGDLDAYPPFLWK